MMHTVNCKMLNIACTVKNMYKLNKKYANAGKYFFLKYGLSEDFFSSK